MIHGDMVKKVFRFINNISPSVKYVLCEQVSHVYLIQLNNEDSCFITQRVWPSLVSVSPFSAQLSLS